MTTISIKNGVFEKTHFKDTKELFDYLVDRFEEETIIVKTSLSELNTKETQAWDQHKKDGYDDFVDFKV